MNSAIVKLPGEPAPQPEYQQPPPPAQGFNLPIVRSLRMHRTLAIVVAFMVFTGLVSFALSRRPWYEAKSLIYVQPITAKLMTDASGGSYDATRYDSYIQQQLQTIVRPDILTEALKKLPIGSWQWPGESDQSAITRLQNYLKVERVLGSYQVEISMKGGDPKAIAEVVNAVTTAFLEKGRVDELAQSDQQLEILSEERQRIQDQLERDRQEQASLSSELGVADTSGENGNPYDVQLEELRKQVATARAAHEVAAAQLASISGPGGQTSESLSAVADDMSASDPELSALKTSIIQRRSVLVSQMAGLTPNNPLYKQDQDELNRLSQTLDSTAKSVHSKAANQVQQRLRLEASRTADVQSRLERQLAEQTSIATGASPKLQRASDLAADIARLQARFTEIDNADRSIELQQSASALIHLSLAAIPPQRPEPSKKDLILALALPLALMCGVGAAVARKMLDPRIYIGEDVKSALKFQPMAVLPDPADVSDKVIDEFMLRFVAGVDQAHRISDVKIYVFTAASAHMEITDLVASLALKMNQMGYRTIILEASAALQNLAPDGSGPSWGTPTTSTALGTQLVHTKRESYVVENLERLKQNVDILFIEALPIRSSAEAEYVARLADATILIAKSARSTRRELTASLALARRLGVSGIAAVLSDVSLRNADEDFLAAVRSVERRNSPVRRQEERAR